MPLFPNINSSQSIQFTSTSYYYCDPGDIQRRLSLENTLLRTEDFGPAAIIAEAGAYEDAIWDATETINLYCFQHYDPGTLQKSGWVNRRATDISTYLLSCRRGNSPSSSMENRYNQALQWLEKVHSGTYEVPGLPMRFTSAPAFSNVKVDQRYQTFRVRVENVISDHSPNPYDRVIDYTSNFDFSF